MKTKTIMLSFAGLVLASICGCTTGGAQPSRSQSQNNEFKDCQITINIGARKATTVATSETDTITNEVVVAESEYAERAAVEWFTQNQNQAGNEKISPEQTNTTDTKPDVDITVPVNRGSSVASGASAVAGAVGTLAAAATQGIADAMSKDSTTQTADATASGATLTPKTNCTNCTTNADGTVICTDCTPQ